MVFKDYYEVYFFCLLKVKKVFGRNICIRDVYVTYYLGVFILEGFERYEGKVWSMGIFFISCYRERFV